MAIGKHLTDYHPDGTSFGQDASDKVTFYGGTPVARPSGALQAAVSTAAISAVATTAVTTAAGIYGFTTAAQGLALATAINSLITQVAAQTALLNQVRSDLVTLNLLKGS